MPKATSSRSPTTHDPLAVQARRISSGSHGGVGVTALDASRLQMSWDLVAQHGDQVPLFFYSTLFVTHPHTRDMFPLSMEGQRDKLVTALGRVVSHVDRLAAVTPILEQLGRDHRRFSVTREHYPAVGRAPVASGARTSPPTGRLPMRRWRR